MKILSGIPASPGYGIANVFRYEPFRYQVSEEKITSGQIEQTLARYEEARQKATDELQAIVCHLQNTEIDKEGIFLAQIDILQDEVMDEEIRFLIEEELCAPDFALEQIYTRYADLIGASEDPLIRERAKDLTDVKLRLLRCWHGIPERSLAHLDEDVIIVTHDLLPSDTATLDRAHVMGIVTEVGGLTSHTAILAKSYEIPAVVGVQDACRCLREGTPLIIDGDKGLVLSAPDSRHTEEYRARKQVFEHAREIARTFLPEQPILKSGERIKVELNIASIGEEELRYAPYVDGVGLFRTEFLYLKASAPPSEEEQYQVYAKALSLMGDRPLTLRTLDIGGDKQIDYLQLEQESNPFLGNRALRLCLSRPELFRTQLRAALRASVHGNLQLMFPMVSSMEDICAAKAAVAQVKEELEREHIPVSPTIKLGIMVEIPSIALMAEQVSRCVDFVSIGSNDLCQYLTAADRLNPAVERYYQPFHPAVFRLIGYVARAMQAEGKSVGICGELGGDSGAAVALIGLGVDCLSMNPTSIASIKQVICALTLEQAQRIATECLKQETAADCRHYLSKALSKIVP